MVFIQSIVRSLTQSAMCPALGSSTPQLLFVGMDSVRLQVRWVYTFWSLIILFAIMRSIFSPSFGISEFSEFGIEGLITGKFHDADWCMGSPIFTSSRRSALGLSSTALVGGY